MTRRPPPQLLQRLLADQLPNAEQEASGAHACDCPLPADPGAKRKVVGEMLRKDTRSCAVLRVKDGLDAAQVAEDLTAQFKSPAIVARTEAD
jgi:hypothetical protein